MSSLVRFKSKFTPRWVPRYLAVENSAVLPEALIALVRAHLPPLSLRTARLLISARTNLAA